MKVVLFCGGYGLRMRSEGDARPKPMMPIGARPVLWHVMRYYAYFGYNDFILCLGYGAQAIKDYFLEYRETSSNDFVLTDAGRRVELLTSDISDWRITFVDTGLNTSIGERLRRVRQHLADDEIFLANYGDVLSDAPMDEMVKTFAASDAVAALLATPPQATFHVLAFDGEGMVKSISAVTAEPMWINGGFFVLRQGVFDYLHENEDLVGDALPRIVDHGKLMAFPHSGFWAPMDTLKERAELEALHRSGRRPWALWDEHRLTNAPPHPTSPSSLGPLERLQ